MPLALLDTEANALYVLSCILCRLFLTDHAWDHIMGCYTRDTVNQTIILGGVAIASLLRRTYA